ncbi:cell division protein FtsK [Amycolatopsis antarctica]|uniref:Cell division protein FtsK n=1 Tax=Amycolatopsis antarctica TaxID=1854586 RepID=A0A263CVA3_9PSEU|nr:hypothetical protein [Amycolatopsis antarctica]OZM69909.1 cell division protein FtsK [Amycolatopsis antarctica]
MSTRDTPQDETNIVYLPSAGTTVAADRDRGSDAPGTAETPAEETAEVIDGELVPAEENARIDARLAQQQRGMLALREASAVQAVQLTHRIAESDKPREVGSALVRHVLYVPAGAVSVGKRIWDSRTTARYERQMRSAEAAGDNERLAEWEERGERFKANRHNRIMDWIKAPIQLAKALLLASAAILGLLLGLGIVLAIANKDADQILAPLKGVFELVRWISIAVTVAWGPLVLAAPWVAVLALWNEGRKRSNSEGWLRRVAPSRNDDGSTMITADGIVRALQHLRVPEIKKAFKDGWLPTFELPPTRDGNGYRAIFDVPFGVTPGMIADQRPILARNLHRAEVEVWPADHAKANGGTAGCVDLWVAKPGTLSKPAPPYPLLHSGTADVFAGVPVGISQRGDEIVFPLVEANFVAGGNPGQGKSNLCRVIMLGAALDPLAELHAYVFAGNGDFDSFAPRLARYVRGATDEVAAAGLAALAELAEEVGQRETRLSELGAKKVTRALAEKHPELRPKIAVFSECHELFGHPDFGKEAADYAVQTVKRGRKTGIILGFDTQSSRKEAIPPRLVELVKLNACFAVKTWRSNDGFLGDGSFAAGVRATELRQGKDRGTCLVTGIGEEAFEIVKAYYIDVDDETGWDAATDVIARAMEIVSENVPTGAASQAQEPEEERDFLEDVAEVLGTETVRAARIPALLQRLAPRWVPYRALSGKQVVSRLADHGVKVPTTGNKWPVDPVTVRQAMAVQSTADLDEDDE